MTSELKLHALRTKTNRELAELVARILDRGLASARDLASNIGEKSYEQACAWLPLLGRPERQRLERKLEQLRRVLDEAAGSGKRLQCACG
jgi:hypothetical protein